MTSNIGNNTQSPRYESVRGLHREYLRFESFQEKVNLNTWRNIHEEETQPCLLSRLKSKFNFSVKRILQSNAGPLHFAIHRTY